MKQTRRGLLGTLATIAAAVTLTPAVKPEAWNPSGLARSSSRDLLTMPKPEPHVATFTSTGTGSIALPDGRVIGSGEMGIYPLTFEAMQADCAARGCSLDSAVYPFRGTTVYWHDGDDALTFQSDTASRDLTHVDAWRQGLHDAR